ncbi:hypothetical protein BV22DRAFT_1020341 [Leucogyrophana mollusca]|uniref:Uncharacterized protein n=1 Tax=Leucogyrophana mollusca TaxID=85980 RepID=A0ACB8B6T7_9AGAM|nr:hypothetical protein BV22DRAFT_1020341 [Leucogyrophana mollusca]
MPTAAARITYVAKPSGVWAPDDVPPLALLEPSLGAGAKLRLDKSSSGQFELSRKIRAVCDAFRNVVQVAFGVTCHEHIPTLGALCSTVIGQNIPLGGVGAISDRNEDDQVDDNELLQLVDDIYESVPPHLRSPITHPAHIPYLVDLHARWINAMGTPSTTEGLSPYTTSAFSRAVLDALVGSGAHAAWGCKAVRRFAHKLETCDFESFVPMVNGLADAIAAIERGQLKGKAKNTQTVDTSALKQQLADWINILIDHMFDENGKTQDTTYTQYLDIDTSVALLERCCAAKWHVMRIGPTGSDTGLSDVLTTLATCLFLTYRGTPEKIHLIENLLKETRPNTTTFAKLVACMIPTQLGISPRESAERFMIQLQAYSSVLRHAGLRSLEASLWACALRHFETTIDTNQVGMETYRQMLTEGVDDAERRCFGSDMPDGSPSQLTQSQLRSHRRQRPSGEWEWEEMVGCWIRKTPDHKRRKVDHESPAFIRRLLRRGSARTPLIASRPASASSSSTTSSRPIFSRSPSLQTSDSFDEESDPSSDGYDKENDPVLRSPTLPRKPLSNRRTSNFSSLLADAQMNRIVLHPKQKPQSTIVQKSVPIPTRHLLPQHTPPRPSRPPRESIPDIICAPVVLPSDDSLDLFAYATSSPTR